MKNFSEGFKRLVEPAKSKQYREAFLSIVREAAGFSNIKEDDTDLILYILNEAYNDLKIKDALYLADGEGQFPTIKEDVMQLSDKEYGIVLGSILYVLVKKDQIPVRLNEREKILQTIYLLQGFR